MQCFDHVPFSIQKMLAQMGGGAGGLGGGAGPSGVRAPRLLQFDLC